VGEPRFAGWNAPLTFDLSAELPAFGLSDALVNYYAAGAPPPGSSVWSRFDPTSPFYECWVGSYVVHDVPAEVAAEWTSCRDPDADDVLATAGHAIELTVVDTDIWNAVYGDESLGAAVASPLTVREVHWDHRILGAPTFEVTADLHARSDVGDAGPPFPWYPAWSPASALVDPYAPVVLHATVRFTYVPELGALLVGYRSSTSWSTRDGVEHETPRFVIEQQRAMLDRVRYEVSGCSPGGAP
jgi:hypothetical protein